MRNKINYLPLRVLADTNNESPIINTFYVVPPVKNCYSIRPDDTLQLWLEAAPQLLFLVWICNTNNQNQTYPRRNNRITWINILHILSQFILADKIDSLILTFKVRLQLQRPCRLATRRKSSQNNQRHNARITNKKNVRDTWVIYIKLVINSRRVVPKGAPGALLLQAPLDGGAGVSLSNWPPDW